MYCHSRIAQPLDRVIGAAGVRDDPVVGVGRRPGPPLGVRRFIQRDCVDGDFQCGPRQFGWRAAASPLGDKARSTAFADGHEAAQKLGPVQLVVTVEEQNLVDLPGEFADAHGIDRMRGAVLLNFA